MINKTFCFDCCQEVEYEVKPKKDFVTIDDVRYEYEGKDATCKMCLKPIHVDELYNYNLQQANRVYRK